jgi:catechol 1,2-dioxygenase
MNQGKRSIPTDARFGTVFYELVKELRAFILKHGVSYEEYHQALEFLAEAGAAGELPLLLDVFLETMVDEVNNGRKPGTASCLEGPYYVPGAPLLLRPYALPQRENEPGETLLFSGRVQSTRGVPLAGVMLDLWQADATGRYSQFNYQEPRYNLRGRLHTNEQGYFEIRTVVPMCYEIPKAGPTGTLLGALGRHAFRPAHLHVKLSHEGFEPLTTQLYIAGDPWIESDVVGAVKPALVRELAKHDSPADLEVHGLKAPYFTLGYDFTLAPLPA